MTFLAYFIFLRVLLHTHTHAFICLYYNVKISSSSSSLVSHSPMSAKRLSTDDEDDEESRDHLKILTKKQKSNETPPLAPAQFGIFIQCNGPVSCNMFSTNETVSSTTTTMTTTTTTTAANNNNNNNTESTTADKNETENPSKKQISRKSNENTQQIYFDKIQQQYPNFMKYNLSNEQTSPFNRRDSQR